VRDNTFLNIDDAVNGSIKPTGVIVQDNTAPLLTGLRGYFTWVDGTDWTIIGNTVANSTREHVIRSNSMDTDRVLIEDNNLAKAWRPDDPGEVTKCTINFRSGHDIYIADNTLSGGTIGNDIVTHDTTTVNMSGGVVNHSLLINANSSFNLSGGSIVGDIFVQDSSLLNVFGTGLGSILDDPNFEGFYSEYTLSGHLRDHTDLAGRIIFVQNGSGARFTLNNDSTAVPEPSTFAFLIGLIGAACGGGILRRRKQNQFRR